MSVRSKAPEMTVTPSFRGRVVDARRSDLPDSDLLVLVSRGDLDALGVIYDRHVEAVWKVAVHFSATAAAAQQVVSSVFLRLWRNPQLDDRSILGQLLLNVSRETRNSTNRVSSRTTHGH